MNARIFKKIMPQRLYIIESKILSEVIFVSLAGINFIAVLFAAALSVALGALWYSPAFFGKAWMRLTGINHKDLEKAKKKGMGKNYIAGFLAAIVTSLVLSIFIVYVGVWNLSGGAMIAILVWMGFVATNSLGMILWENKSVKLYLINNGFQLVSLVLMGALLAVWA
ncbi:hypothetical protein COV93_01910 [Candidatus Woesearchaeota archaeon CG11_big_fil_rev_8_21_14_0_20_43_8]|nr:MAG: hypothetical protein COV93_01910 [Candidatus Woesearchaeota archaeon CG11_big_fil_rev_8_21_14_0_20_43_8]PIO05685.1 MAG: hypothetical protein COT47_03715 [Candidatus Woesearchaeota archaeon CG08_land_8_20_14_0_20_43_7]